MCKIVIILLIVLIGGSYLLPASLVEELPQGPTVQRLTKSGVSWSLTTLNDVTDGWFTRTFDNLKQKGQEEAQEVAEDLKDSAKNKIKDVVDEKIDEGIDSILP